MKSNKMPLKTKFFNKQRFSKRSISAASILACAVFLVLINLVFYLSAQRYSFLGIDLTRDKLFRISPDTVRFLHSLEKDVTIYVLAREETFAETSSYNAQANQVFRQFERNGPAVSLVYVDYVKNPGFAASYPDLTIKHGDILVFCENTGRRSLVKTEELFNYTGGYNNLSIGSSRAEEALYAAILNVTSDRPIKAVFISGHGEYTMDAFTGVLQMNNYEISRVNLISGAIDSSTDIAIIIAPKDDYGEEELRILDEFLYNGGNYGKTLFYCADADQSYPENIGVFLREWGVSVEDGAVFETDERRVYNYQPFYPVADYAEEEFSSLIRTTTKPMLVPVSRPLSKIFDFRNNNSVKILLEFAASAGVRPSDAPLDFTSDDALIKGPIPALALCRYTIIDRSTGKAEAESNVLVSGSTAMLDSFAIENPGFSNTEYLVNVLNKLSSRHDIIPLRPKSYTSTALNLPRLTVNIIGLVFIVLIPLLILSIGLAVWIKRKHS
ncbi:MAG: Gldg family protein [Treponema sp.]|nr:Gldg family protein [Treponema sp.]